jgi:hypothetical protein
LALILGGVRRQVNEAELLEESRLLRPHRHFFNAADPTGRGDHFSSPVPNRLRSLHQQESPFDFENGTIVGLSRLSTTLRNDFSSAYPGGLAICTGATGYPIIFSRGKSWCL